MHLLRSVDHGHGVISASITSAAQVNTKGCVAQDGTAKQVAAAATRRSGGCHVFVQTDGRKRMARQDVSLLDGTR
jgi:hypothetical protein